MTNCGMFSLSSETRRSSASIRWRTGRASPNREICEDSDYLFVYDNRHLVYVSCGDGFLDVLDTQRGAYKHVAHIPTIAGARTSLFMPELDRLFLAVRATAGEPSALWIFRPVP